MAGNGRDGDMPGAEEFEALDSQRAFEMLALEVPELLELRTKVEPVRTPIDPTLSFDEARKRRKTLDGGGFLNASARKSMKDRASLRLELAGLVGPRAERGSDLVRSDAAFFKCDVYLFAVPWDDES